MGDAESLDRIKTSEERLRELARGDFAVAPVKKFPAEPLLAALKGVGTEVWIDSADLKQVHPLWRDDCSALTTNNTLVNKVVQAGVMDDVIKETVAGLERGSLDPAEAVRQVGFVVNSRTALRLVENFGCRVSVELHPDIADDVELTVAYGLLYHSVNPERFIVKIPLTPAGIIATRRLSSLGVPVNFTLGFSARQNFLVARLARPAYVNVFLGRLNQVVSESGWGDGVNVGERTTLASQRGLILLRESVPAVRTRQIAASLRNGRQVADLAGVDVHTIPPAALEEFLAIGLDPNQLESKLEADYQVVVAGGKSPDEVGLDLLWDLDDRFLQYVESVSGTSADDISPENLVAEAEAAGLDLFYRFNDQEADVIRSGGKIPDPHRWRGRVALDDLMSRAALLSFASDQADLDARIKSYL